MDDPYLLPGTSVLRNRLGITDPIELHQYEFEATFTRQVELDARRLPGNYDLDHLRAVHRHLFQDVYDWAGEIRTVDIAKDRSLFALARFITDAATDLFGTLRAEKHLGGLGHDAFVGRAAHYLIEINALHPFREGNGRAQRAFIGQLATDAGWRINWSTIDAADNIAASIAGHNRNEQPWRNLFEQATERR